MYPDLNKDYKPSIISLYKISENTHSLKETNGITNIIFQIILD